ncbi:MAG: DUF2520 domain-containing protein [Phycisphaerales bacterium]|nr:DUF2520 domain-containing protein [Phycisphaerales bacterium]
MTDRTTPITIIGAGALGQALTMSLHAAGRSIDLVVSRSDERGQALADAVGARRANSPEGISSQAIILCVPDDHIESVSKQLTAPSGSIVAHCAGSRGLDVLHAASSTGAHVGSIHPVMVLAQAGRGPDALQGATAAIEGNHVSGPWLRQLAEDIGMHAVEIPAENRALYHLSASLVGGLMTGLLAASADLWELLGLDRNTAASALAPMVREAGRNLEELGVPKVVMGPAARGDIGTIKCHLEVLASQAPHLLPLYRELVRLSVPYACEQGLLDHDAAQAVHDVVDCCDQ